MRGFLHHKVTPRPQIRPELAQKMPIKYHLQNSTFGYVRRSDRCHIGNQQLYFCEMTLRKVTRAQEGVPASHSGYPTTNTA